MGRRAQLEAGSKVKGSTLKGKTIASLFWKLLERGGRALVELLVQIVMARLLAPEQFGALAIMLVFVNMGNVIVQSGLNTALIQRSDITDEDYSTVFWMSCFVSAVLFTAIFVASPAIARFYSMPDLISPLRALALIYIINALNSVQVAKVTRDMEMRKLFASTLVSAVISGLLGICFAIWGAELWALVIQQVAYQAVSCLALFVMVDWKPSFTFQVARAKEMLRFGWRLLVSGLLDQGYQSLSDLIIGRQFSSQQLGFVSQGKKYPLAVGSLLDGAIQPVMLSAVSRVQEDIDRVKRLVRRALKTSTYLIVPAMTLFACVAPSLVPLLLGNQWADSVPFMQVYCFVYALLPIHTTNLQALNGMGRSDLFLKLEIIKKAYGVIAILFCAFVLKDVHLLVASYLLTGFISTIVNAWPNRRVIGYSYVEQIQDIAPAFLMSVAAAGVALLVACCGLEAWLTVLLQIAGFAFAYLGLSAVLHVEEFEYLLSTVRSVFYKRWSE